MTKIPQPSAKSAAVMALQNNQQRISQTSCPHTLPHPRHTHGAGKRGSHRPQRKTSPRTPTTTTPTASQVSPSDVPPALTPTCPTNERLMPLCLCVVHRVFAEFRAPEDRSTHRPPPGGPLPMASNPITGTGSQGHTGPGVTPKPHPPPPPPWPSGRGNTHNTHVWRALHNRITDGSMPWSVVFGWWWWGYRPPGAVACDRPRGQGPVQ